MRDGLLWQVLPSEELTRKKANVQSTVRRRWLGKGTCAQTCICKQLRASKMSESNLIFSGNRYEVN
jgi:hypothetical protein